MFKVRVNPDAEVREKVSKAIKDNEGFCPCRISKVPDNLCMCKEFKEQTYTGYCHCGLYYKVPSVNYVAVDFDGTIVSHKFPFIGEPNLELIEKLNLMHSAGIKVILHTCREDNEVDSNGDRHNYLEDALEWCKSNNVPVDAVNENPWVSFGGRKIYADMYIDDRAFNIDNIACL